MNMEKVPTCLFLVSGLFLLESCIEKVDKNAAWPNWPSRPLIEDAALTAKSGARTIIAEESVHYSAKIKDEFNTLSSYTLEIRYGSTLVCSLSGDLEGNKQELNLDFNMPFAANMDQEEFTPEITLVVRNEVGGESSQRLPNSHNLHVTRPDLPGTLYVVDNLGHVFPLDKAEGDTYKSRPGTDLSTVGDRLYVACKVKEKTPDFSGMVWGEVNGMTAIVKQGGEALRTPDNGGYGFKQLDFDSRRFILGSMIDYTLTIEKNKMDSQEQSGVIYLAKENVQLIRNCQVVFDGFGDLKKILQPDRFEVIDDTTARFTGQSTQWSFYYDTADDWMILDYAVNNTSDQLWVTGIKACFPLGGEESEHEFRYLDGDGKVRFATLAAVKNDNGSFKCLAYFKDGFYIQLYRWIKWSTIVSMVSLTPTIGAITPDRNYIVSGSAFVPGIYLLTVTFTDPGDTSGDGAKAEISMTPCSL